MGRAGKASCTLNQSTRIDYSTEDSKSLDLTTKTEANRKVSSFYLAAATQRPPVQSERYGNKNRLKIKRLKKKVSNQQKLINVLVTWVKIYYEQEQSSK
jgi:hypothetical protein